MKIRLPQTFQDLTLRQWQALHTHKDNLDCLLALCDGLTTRTINDVSKHALSVAYEHLDQLRTEEQTVHVPLVDVDGTTYGFIPDWQAFTLGEYIDMERWCADPVENAHRIMSLLYRKVDQRQGDRYSIEKYTSKEDADMWLDMPATLFGGTLLFFWSSKRRLLKSTRSSLIQAMVEVASLKLSGAGTSRSTRWRARASSIWTQLRKRRLAQR